MKASRPLMSLLLACLLLAGTSTAQDPARFLPRDPQIFVKVARPWLLGDLLTPTGPFRELLILMPGKDREELETLRELITGVGGCLEGPACLAGNFGLLGKFSVQAAAATSLSLDEIEARLAQMDSLPDKPGRQRRGDHDLLGFGDDLVATVRGGQFLVASGLSDLQEMLSLTEEKSAAANKALVRFFAEAGSAEALGCLKLGVLLKDDAARAMKADNFLGTILLEGLRRDLDQAERLYFQATTSPDLSIRLRMIGPEQTPDWATASRETAVLGPLTDELARLQVDRDIASFWRDRESLVTARALPGLAEFSQNLDTLLAGFSTAEFAAALEPGLEFIALGKRDWPFAPKPLLPRMILAFQLRADRPADLDDRLRVGFQTAIGAVNLGAGREHRRPYLQFSRTQDGHEILAARLVGTTDAQPGLAENFEPALCIVGNRLVIASDSLAAEEAVRTAVNQKLEKSRGDRLEIDGAAVASMVLTNRTELENARMLDEGETPEEATLFVDRLADLAGSIDRLAFRRINTTKGAVWDLLLQRSGDRR